VSEKYEFVETMLTDSDCEYPIHLMCLWLAVSRSGFYDWRGRPQSATARRRNELKVLIATEFADSDETSGYRRVHAALVRRGVVVGKELVRFLMRELGLEPCPPRPWRHNLTEGDPDACSIPDIVRRDFTAQARGEKWSATLPMFRRGRAGCTWRPSSTATPRKSLATRWTITTAPR
jgi:putative transposase